MELVERHQIPVHQELLLVQVLQEKHLDHSVLLVPVEQAAQLVQLVLEVQLEVQLAEQQVA
jgi:type III secretion system FlhB-like substrate exporter